MDDNLGYLFAAFAITWVGLAAYLAYVNQQVRSLRDDLEDLAGK
jgi:CcmD family protein